MSLTKKYTIEIEGQKAQATVGQLKDEIARLETELDGVVVGSAEADAAIRKLGAAKGALKELEDAVDALDPKAMAGGLLDLANGVTGAFSVATVAAENFGLASSGSAEEVEKKMLQLLTVMSAFEAIHKALNSETQSVMKNLLSSSLATIKSTLGLGEAYTVAGIKARLFGTTARAALTATGIGILLVAVGLLVANFDKVLGVVDKFKQRFQPQFAFVSNLIDGLIAKARDLASFLTFGLVDDAATAAIAKAEEAEAKMLETKIANRKRLIAEEAAAGRSTYNLKQQNLADELKLLQLQGKKETDEYKDKLSEIRQLKLSHDKSLAERDEKAWKEALEKQKKASEEALKLAQEAYAKRRELEGKALEAERAAADEARKYRLEQAKADGFSPAALLRVEIENLVDLQAELIDQGKRFSSEYLALQNQIAEKEKAIATANLADKKKALDEKKRLQDEELARMQEASEIAVIELKLRGATERQITEETIKGLQLQIDYMEKAGLTRTKAFAELKLQLKELQDGLVPQQNTLMRRMLVNLFNVKPEDLAVVEASIAESLASLQQSLGYIADSLFSDAFMRLDAYTEYLDEQLALAEERQRAAEQGLNEAMKRREQLEGQLENARGAKREHLLQQIAKERKEEERLAAQKKKAAAEEAQITKEKEAAEKRRQQLEAKAQALTAGTTLATNVQNAALAVNAALAATKSGAALPPPANILAIAAGVAAVGAAVISAKNLAKSLQAAKLKNGGLLDGPSHDQGGIPGTGRFANVEVEGGEFVVNKQATVNSWDAIRQINANASMRFIAVPEHQVKRKMAGGGQLEGGTTGASSGAQAGVLISVEDLAAIRNLLASIDANTAASAEKELVTVVDDWTARKITQKAQRVDRDEKAGKLL